MKWVGYVRFFFLCEFRGLLMALWRGIGASTCEIAFSWYVSKDLFRQFLSRKHLLLRALSCLRREFSIVLFLPPVASVPSLSYPLQGQRPACGARFFRSPDRLPGLLDARRRTGRLRSFTLEDALYLSYLRDFRFALLFSLCLGFSLCWVLATKPLFAYPPTCIFGYYAQLLDIY